MQAMDLILVPLFFHLRSAHTAAKSEEMREGGREKGEERRKEGYGDRGKEGGERALITHLKRKLSVNWHFSSPTGHPRGPHGVDHVP